MSRIHVSINVYQDIESQKVTYTGYIMNKDVKVARVTDNQVTKILNAILCPFYIRRKNSSFETWVISRTIDTHRPNSRILRKLLKLKNPDTLEIAMKAKCRTITDSFWFKEDDSTITYNDILFKDDLLKDTALLGMINSLEEIDILTPELTNIGSFEKCWVLDKNKDWNLRKVANRNELFSEIFIGELCRILGFNYVQYHRVDNTNIIECKNFIESENQWFEPMFSLLNDNEDYTINYKLLKNMEEAFRTSQTNSLCSDYLNLIFMDALVQNPDRHTFNYGLIVENGEKVSLAPNFDNNLALISRGLPRTLPNKNNILIKEFIKLIKTNSITYDIPYLDKGTIEMLIEYCCAENKLEPFEEETITKIVDFIYNNYFILKTELESI